MMAVLGFATLNISSLMVLLRRLPTLEMSVFDATEPKLRISAAIATF